MTECEIAKELGISQTRVQQIERSALKKLARLPECRLMLQMARFYPKEDA